MRNYNSNTILKKGALDIKKLFISLKKAEAAVYKLLDVGGEQSTLNIEVEIAISIIICLNVVLIILESIAGFEERYASVLVIARNCFFVFFLIEYILRVWIADMVMHNEAHPVKSRLRYIFSLRAIIDLLSLLPVIFGTIIDYRVFRMLRLFRVTRLKTTRKYTDTLSRVIKMKRSELLASIFIVFIFMLSSAIIIYELEHQAQPEVFDNVMSGLWWSIAAILTIGYGDIYPITDLGKVFGSIMSISGVFLMAIPTAILTSGFLESTKNDKSDD